MKKVLFVFLYWFLSLTWGIIASTIGVVVSLFAIIFGENWGDLELGCFALCSNYSGNHPYYYD